MDRKLLAEIRRQKRPFGTLFCDVGSDLVMVGSATPNLVTDYTYDEFRAAVKHRKELSVRLPYFRANAPKGPGPHVFGPVPDSIGEAVLPTSPPFARQKTPNWQCHRDYQPWCEAVLERAERRGVVLVGDGDCVFAAQRPAVAPIDRVWYCEPVTETPVILRDTGISPRLSGCRVAVVGLGSLGSQATAYLAAAGVSELLLIDPETLQLRNARRHLCGVEYLGESKVEAVKTELHRHGYDIDIHTEVAEVHKEQADEFRGRFAELDLVCCFADASPPQQFVNHTAVTLEIGAVIANIQVDGPPWGEIAAVRPGRGGCFACWRQRLERQGALQRAARHDHRDYPGPEYSHSGLPMYQLAIVAAASCDLASVIRARDGESVVWLTALDQAVSGLPDHDPRQPRIHELPRERNCPVCGGSGK